MKTDRLRLKDDTLRMIMACKLRELRIEAGLSQDDLAIAVGLSRSSISNLEVADHGMTATLIFKFCAVLKCDYADIFPHPDEHQAEIFEIKKPTAKQILAEKLRKKEQRLRRIERGGKK